MAEKWQQWLRDRHRSAQESEIRSSPQTATNQTEGPLSSQKVNAFVPPHMRNVSMGHNPSTRKERSGFHHSTGQAPNEGYPATNNYRQKIPAETTPDLSSRSQNDRFMQDKSSQNGTAKPRLEIKDQRREEQDEEEGRAGLWRSRWADESQQTKTTPNKRQESTIIVPVNRQEPPVLVQTPKNEPQSSKGCSTAAIDEPFGVGQDTKHANNKKENLPSPKEEKRSTGNFRTDIGSQCHEPSEGHLTDFRNGLDAMCQVKEPNPQPSTTKALIRATGPCSEIKSESLDRSSKASTTGVREIDYEGPSPHLDTNRQPESDFRAKEPHQIWTCQNWDETRRPRIKQNYADESASQDSDEEVGVSSYLQEYIDNWRQTAHQIETNFLISEDKNQEECDVDTETGIIMPAVDFPLTKSKYHEAGKITSEMRIESCIMELAIKKAKKKKKKEARAAAEVEQEPSARLPPGPNEVLIPSHLRPASETDMEGVAEIYNNEVQQGYKVMDAGPVGLERFRHLYQASRREKMPFVVAFQGWHNPLNNPNPRLIGFALVDAVARGITGSYATRSRHGGKIMVIVHPDFRHKKIGTALLDVIFSCCSPRYSSKQGYQFLNPMQDLTLMHPAYNLRIWHYLEMEVIIRTGESEAETRKGDEFQWIWNFLEERFLLILKHYDEKVLRDPGMDPNQGLDKLTFRHICRNLKEE